jgi:hypothetical protein
MSDIVDFKFVPWGNGRIEISGTEYNTTSALSSLLAQVPIPCRSDQATRADVTPEPRARQTHGADGVQRVKGIDFFCQHGGAECGGNAYESCIQVPTPRQTRP